MTAAATVQELVSWAVPRAGTISARSLWRAGEILFQQGRRDERDIRDLLIIGGRLDHEQSLEKRSAVRHQVRPKDVESRAHEKARLMLALSALENPVIQLRQAIFEQTEAPFPTWNAAVSWIRQQDPGVAEIRRASVAARDNFTAVQIELSRAARLDPYNDLRISRRGLFLEYEDERGSARIAAALGGTTFWLATASQRWSDLTGLSAIDILCFVLAGERPARLATVGFALQRSLRRSPSHKPKTLELRFTVAVAWPLLTVVSVPESDGR